MSYQNTAAVLALLAAMATSPAFAGGTIKDVKADKAKVGVGQEVDVSILVELSKSDPGCAFKVVLTHGDKSTEEVLSMGLNNPKFETAVKTKVLGNMTIAVSGVKIDGVPKCKKQAKTDVEVVKGEVPLNVEGRVKAKPKLNIDTGDMMH